MEGLGRIFDVGIGWMPVDLNTANGATGKRLAMMVGRSVTFLVAVGAAASGTDDLVLNLRQHTAYTGGTSADLDSVGASDSTGIDHEYIKSETLLDNDEKWVKVTQAAASEVTLVGATYAALEKLVIISVDARALGAGFTHISLDAAITTAAAQLGTCLYLVHELRYQRAPTKLFNLLRPGVANA